MKKADLGGLVDQCPVSSIIYLYHEVESLKAWVLQCGTLIEGRRKDCGGDSYRKCKGNIEEKLCQAGSEGDKWMKPSGEHVLP